MVEEGSCCFILRDGLMVIFLFTSLASPSTMCGHMMLRSLL